MIDPRMDPSKVGETICKDYKHNPLALNLSKMPTASEIMDHLRSCQSCHADPKSHKGYASFNEDVIDVRKGKATQKIGRWL